MSQEYFEGDGTILDSIPEIEDLPDLSDMIEQSEHIQFDGKDMELTLFKTGTVSACFEGSCHELGEGAEAYNAVKRFFDLNKVGE